MLTASILTDERVVQIATWIILTLLGLVSYLLLNWYNNDKKNKDERINGILSHILDLRKTDEARFTDYKFSQDRLYGSIQAEIKDLNLSIKKYIDIKEEQEKFMINKLEEHETILNKIQDE